jgi:hypothetical protein
LCVFEDARASRASSAKLTIGLRDVLVVAKEASGGEGKLFRNVPQRSAIEQPTVDLVAMRVGADGAGSRHGEAPDASGSDYREWKKICETVIGAKRYRCRFIGVFGSKNESHGSHRLASNI